MADILRFVDALAEDDVVQKSSLRDGHGDYVAVGSNKHIPSEELQAYLYRAPYVEATTRIRAKIAADYGGQSQPSERQDRG